MNNNKEVEKEESETYKIWIVGVMIATIIFIMICLSVNSNNQNTSASANTINMQNNTSNKIAKETKEDNPYEAVNDYDGLYSFILLDNNGSVNYQFNSVGAIEIDNGKCKVKYKEINISILEDTTNTNYYDREYEGFCGINKKDGSSFYLLIKARFDNDVIYKCTLLNNKLVCELKSEYNLSGCNNNKNLELIKIDGTSDINTICSQKFEEEKLRIEKEQIEKEEQEKQAFLSSCQTYTFEQMARNPDNFKGTNVKLTGEVVQALYDMNTVDLRVNITKKGSYSTYYTDTIYITYTPKAGEDKILEDDIITIYGTSQGDYSYTSTIGSKITLPLIAGKYITIDK